MKKYLSLLVLLVSVGGVGFIVINAIQNQYGSPSEESYKSLDALDKLKQNGLIEIQSDYINGKEFSNGDIKSPIMIVNFWASWCAPCIEEIPSFIELVNHYNGQVSLVAISLDSDKSEMEKFLANFNMNNPNIHVLWDPEFKDAQGFGSLKLPESFIFGSDRQLVRKVSGAIDWVGEDIKLFFDTYISNARKN